MATPTSAWASAGASLVPSPHIATSLPWACSSRISFSLASGVAWARKSSTPASAAMAAAVSGLSPVIMTVRMPIRRKVGKALADAALDDVLEVDDAQQPAVLATTASGVPPRLGDLVGDGRRLRADGRRHWPPLALTSARIGIDRALADRRAVDIDAADAAYRPRTGNELACSGAISRPRMLYFSLASTTIERPSGVSSDSEASWAASAKVALVDAATGRNSVAWRLPSVMVPVLSSSSVSTSPAASTARPDMASTLKRTSRSMPAMPMADRSAPMVVGIRVTNSATSTSTLMVPPA